MILGPYPSIVIQRLESRNVNAFYDSLTPISVMIPKHNVDDVRVMTRERGKVALSSSMADGFIGFKKKPGRNNLVATLPLLYKINV